LQFQQQVQELEEVRTRDAARCSDLEQELALQQQDWQKQSQTEQQDK
jgi:hypothetical protein